MENFKTPHWEGRINKITKFEISDSLLSKTWIGNRNCELYKAFDNEIDFENKFQTYIRNKNDIKLRTEVFNSFVWYAAYLAHFARIRLYYLCSDYEHYLGYALKRIWEDIKMYNEYEKCNIYTYIHNDYMFRIKRETEELYSNDLLTTSSRMRMRTVMNTAIHLGLTFEEIYQMPDREFFCTFNGVSKKIFIYSMAAGNIYSLQEKIDEDDGSSPEAIDLVKDDYTSSFADKICGMMNIDEIYEMAKKLYNKNERKYSIWKMYMSGRYTLQEVGDKYRITRERVRQIVDAYNTRLRKNKRIIAMKDEIYS